MMYGIWVPYVQKQRRKAKSTPADHDTLQMMRVKERSSGVRTSKQYRAGTEGCGENVKE